MIGCLNVVILIEKVQNSLHLLLCVIIGEGNPGLGNHGHVRLKHGNVLLLQSLAHCGEIIRCGEDLVAVLFLGEVFCAGIQCHHHQVVGFHLALFLIDDDLALLIKHEGNAARSSDIAVALGECRTYVGCGTVLVVGKGLYNDCHAGRAVALIGQVLVVDGIGVTGCLLDASVDGIVGHVGCLRLGNHIAKLAVVGRICTALFYGNRDLTADNGKDLALSGIILLFLVLDIGKF